MKRHTQLFLSLICLVAGTMANAQAVRQVNPVPLKRPEPLVIARGEVRAILETVDSIVRLHQFVVDKVNWTSGELEASRTDTRSPRPAMDKVLVWLETSIVNAADIHVYFEYGRYETFLGSPELKRALLDSSEERTRVGMLKQALVAARFGRP